MGHGKTAEKQPEKRPKHPKNSCFDCFSGVSGVFRLFFGCFSAVLSSPTRHPFRLFFGCFHCRAFGTSVAGRRDCNPTFGISGQSAREAPANRGRAVQKIPILLNLVDVSDIFIFFSSGRGRGGPKCRGGTPPPGGGRFLLKFPGGGAGFRGGPRGRESACCEFWNLGGGG